jgi:uncharacterized membrane protein
MDRLIVFAIGAVVFVPALIAAGLVSWWLRLRLRALETMHETVRDLSERVRLLEHRGLPPALPPVPSHAPIEIERAPEAPRPPRFRPAVASSDENEALETRIGSRWLLYIGIFAIIVGVSYFEKLAIDNHWISETARVIQGAMAGGLFISGGLVFVRRGYRTYGQIVSGCGIAILYVSTYAAFNFYHLIAHGTAFGVMAVVTLLAASLADRQISQPLAIVAVSGGFLTPFLLSSGTDAEAALFTYVSMLVGGTALLARRRDWPALNIVSYGLTILTIFAWATTFFTPAKYLVTEFFLTVLCGLFLYILSQIIRSDPDRTKENAGRDILSTAPLAYHLVSLAVLWEQPPAFLLYVSAIALIGAVVSAKAWMRLGFWISVAAPLLLWTHSPLATAETGGALAAWTVVFALNLAGVYFTTLSPESFFERPAVVLLHANGLVAFVGAYPLLARLHADAAASVAVLLAIVNGALASRFVSRRREEALHFVAVGFTFLTIAIALQLRGAWVPTAWAAEGAVVAWLGLRERREWLRVAGLILVAVATAQVVGLDMARPPIDELILLNPRAFCSLYVISLLYALSVAHCRYHRQPGGRPDTAVALALVANVLTLLFVTSEISAYWNDHAGVRPSRATFLSMQASFSIVWALYATLLVIAGFRRRYPQIRYLAIAVFTFTIGKVFMVDLSQMDAVYRVLSVVGLGVALLITSYFYQRFAADQRIVESAEDVSRFTR